MDRYNDRLLPLLRQFLFIPNRNSFLIASKNTDNKLMYIIIKPLIIYQAFLRTKRYAWVGSTLDFTFYSAWIQNLTVLLFSLRHLPLPSAFPGK